MLAAVLGFLGAVLPMVLTAYLELRKEQRDATARLRERDRDVLRDGIDRLRQDEALRTPH